MKKNPTSQSGFFYPRVLLAAALCSVGVLLAMLSFAATPPSGIRGSHGDSVFVDNHAVPFKGNAATAAANASLASNGAWLVTHRLAQHQRHADQLPQSRDVCVSVGLMAGIRRESQLPARAEATTSRQRTRADYILYAWGPPLIRVAEVRVDATTTSAGAWKTKRTRN